MMDHANAEQDDRQTVYYHDPLAAAEWLVAAFGCEQLVLGAAHSDASPITLRLDDVLIDIRPVTEMSDRDASLADRSGELESQSCYLLVADIEDLYSRISGYGIPIVFDNPPDAERQRSFGCRDPEGVIWFVGSSAQSDEPVITKPKSRRRGFGFLFPGLALVAAISGGLYWSFGVGGIPQPQQQTAQTANDNRERLQDLQRQLSEARAAIDLARQAARQAQVELQQQRQVQEQAERAIELARLEIEQLKVARKTAETQALSVASELRSQQERSGLRQWLDTELELQVGENEARRAAAERAAQQEKERSQQIQSQHVASLARLQALSDNLKRQLELQQQATGRIARLEQDLARETKSRKNAELALSEIKDRLSRSNEQNQAPVSQQPATQQPGMTTGKANPPREADRSHQSGPSEVAPAEGVAAVTRQPTSAAGQTLDVLPTALPRNAISGPHKRAPVIDKRRRNTKRVMRKRRKSSTARFRTRPRL